jgi:predicted dienelactone hydrolase
MVGRMGRMGWVLVAVLAVAMPATAQDDACRAGVSSLTDRRDLDALRTAIDDACPCDARGGRARRDYIRCARRQVAAALSNDALRPACTEQAQRDLRLATCGTNRVACGQVDDSGEPSCRLASPSGRQGCGQHPRLEEGACAAQTHCVDVDEWTAGTCLDPRRRGPYGVGARVVPMVKDSVVAPGTPRTLDTVVWYPSTVAAPLDPDYAAVLDAPLDPAGAPYPVMMFSHGSCGYATQSLFLTALLASYGYVVVSPPHPGNTLVDFPACGTPAVQVNSAVERPRDIIFALDQMLAASAADGSPFAGGLDADRVGMMGHSFGGFTTYGVLPLEPRFKVAVPLAAAVPGQPRVTIPSLTMLGAVDARVNNATIRTAYANATPPKVLVEIGDAGHYAFSDLCFPSPDCSPPVTTTQEESHALVLRWVVPFLEQYLAGRSAESFFTAPPPGAVVSQQR